MTQILRGLIQLEFNLAAAAWNGPSPSPPPLRELHVPPAVPATVLPKATTWPMMGAVGPANFILLYSFGLALLLQIRMLIMTH